MRGREFFGMELSGVGDWDVRRLLRRVMLFTVFVEGLTFLLLLPWFLAEGETANGAWRAFFHALSAFNNAGFDIMGGLDGFTNQVSAPYPVVVMGVAAFLGSLSFLTVFNLRRRPRRWTLDTRLVVIGMGLALLLGTLVFAVGEVQSGRALDGLGVPDVLTNSFFLSVNRTTGMATVDMALLGDVTTVGLLGLMFIGGASTSTASGIKIGTFMVSLVVIWSSLRGRHRAEIFGRTIPQPIVLRALTVVLLGIMMLMLGIWMIEFVEDAPFLPLVFEVMSALANVGWSQGLTADLTTDGAMILVVLMFVGRLGPLMVALAMPARDRAVYRYPEEGVRIG